MPATTRPTFEPQCLATTLGSLPHTDVARATDLVFRSTPHIPAWVQFPRRVFHENMMVQFTAGLPGLVTTAERVYFDTTLPDMTEQLTDFYTRYLAATEGEDPVALDSFGLSEAYASGFWEFFSRLSHETTRRRALKGQVTGPFTLGTNLLDQERRCAYYDDTLHDVIVKTVALKAAWQIRTLRGFGQPLLIFLDEPALLGFGSQTFLTISREDVLHDLNKESFYRRARGERRENLNHRRSHFTAECAENAEKTGTVEGAILPQSTRRTQRKPENDSR